MKKILSSLIALFVLVAVSFATDPTTNAWKGFNANQKPSDVYFVSIGCGLMKGDSALKFSDTIAAGGHVRYGPYPMSIDPSRPSFKYLRFYAPIGALVADSLQVAYQLLSGNSLADTGAVTQWVATDTLTPGEFGTTVDISAKAGVSILFRVMNTAGATAIIRKPLRAILKEPSATSIDAKH
jgi:hypothetical protein